MKWYNKILGAGALTLAGLSFSSKKVEACSSAIPIGRGGTNVAVADDASAAYWNPAGLVQLERPELDVTVGLGGVYKGFLCYGQPLNDRNAVGVNLAYRNIKTNYIESRGEYNYNTVWLKLSYSGKLTDKLSVGGNLTIERGYNGDEVITWEHDGKTFQTYLNRDLGVLYKLNDKIRLGLLLQGYGFNHSEILRPGASFKLDDKTLLAIEGYDVTNKANSRHARFGLEKRINDRLSLRGGFKIYEKGNEISGGPFNGMLSGSVGASYRKGDLETSIAILGKSIVLGLNKKF